MVGIRELMESDLSVTLEGDFAEKIDLIDPDGVRYQDIPAQVLREHIEETENGIITVQEPIVTIRLKTLVRIPKADETWHVLIPSSPVAGAAKIDFITEKAPIENNSIGFVRLYLTKAVQS